jgi:hydroxymethylglutaryl-CoA reductase
VADSQELAAAVAAGMRLEVEVGRPHLAAVAVGAGTLLPVAAAVVVVVRCSSYHLAAVASEVDTAAAAAAGRVNLVEVVVQRRQRCAG